MDDTGAAPQQRLVFGGQLPFGNKPVRPQPPARPQPSIDPRPDLDEQLDLEDQLVLAAEERERAREAALAAPVDARAAPEVPEPVAEVRPVPRPEPAVWDVARPAHLPPAPPAVQESEPEIEPEIEAEPVPEYPEPPRTGDHAVDEVLVAVALAVTGPLEEQLAVFDAAHRTLQGRLADVEG
jgi:hypothetical protein